MLDWVNWPAIAVGGVLLVLTELFSKSADPTAKHLKHFSAVLLFSASVALGICWSALSHTQTALKATQEKLSVLKAEVEKHLGIDDQIRDLVDSYNRNFATSAPELQVWAKDALSNLSSDMAKGRVSLPRELAPEAIARLYQSHPDPLSWILATNVGSTNLYFYPTNPLGANPYVQANVSSADAHVPVIRFYIFGLHRVIYLSNGKEAHNINEYFNDIKQLHDSMHTLYSAVIDWDQARMPSENSEIMDVLLLEDGVTASTVLDQRTWQPIKAVAMRAAPGSDDPYKSFFAALYNSRDANLCLEMSANQVKQFFPQYGGQTAGQIVDGIVRGFHH